MNAVSIGTVSTDGGDATINNGTVGSTVPNSLEPATMEDEIEPSIGERSNKRTPGARGVSKEQEEDVLTNHVGKLSTSISNYFDAQAANQTEDVGKIINDVKEELNSQKDQLDEALVLMKSGFASLRRFDALFEKVGR